MEPSQIKESEVWAALKVAGFTDIFTNEDVAWRSPRLGFTTHDNGKVAAFWVAWLHAEGYDWEELPYQLYVHMDAAVRQGSWVYWPDIYVLWGE